jgi:hypothetical protein
LESVVEMSDRKTYTATAERDGRFWYLAIGELDAATQARRLDQAELMVRDLISIKTGEPAESFEVKIVPAFGGDVGQHVARALRAKSCATTYQAISSLARRIAATDLEESGLTVRDIGVVLGVSHQRAAQLLAAEADRDTMAEDFDRLLAEAGTSVDWCSAMNTPDNSPRASA